jgi:hypothetical protein
MIAALLCSNHITYRFGKGLTPKQYRLDVGTMAVIMDEYAKWVFLFFSVNPVLTSVKSQHNTETTQRQMHSSDPLLTAYSQIHTKRNQPIQQLPTQLSPPQRQGHHQHYQQATTLILD